MNLADGLLEINKADIHRQPGYEIFDQVDPIVIQLNFDGLPIQQAIDVGQVPLNHDNDAMNDHESLMSALGAVTFVNP